MKIFHASDLHYCPEHLDEVDRCFNHAIDRLINALDCDVAVISGDLFDRRVEVHQPAVSRLLDRIEKLATHVPVLILQGTFSHDQPGSLDIFRTIGGLQPVHVADTIQQVALLQDGTRSWSWAPSKEFIFQQDDHRLEVARAIFSCLPPINKGTIGAAAASVGEDAATAAGEYVYNLMRAWAVINERANAGGVHTAVVSHGTVNGCTTEHGVPMHGQDHEFSTGGLFASQARHIMLGHIHQHQAWHDPDTSQVIAYPGSIGRLHFGEMTDKGFLIWDSASTALPEFMTTPAKRLLQIEFGGPPDMQELKSLAIDAADAHVRIRWVVDEEHRDSVDKDAIRALFEAAENVKLEGRIRPIQRQRAAGISQAHSLGDRLDRWAKSTGSHGDPLQDRLAMLEHMEPEAIVEQIIAVGHEQASKEDAA